MKKAIIAVIIIIPVLIAFLGIGSPTKDESVRDKLIKWRTGVWLTPGGTYTVWTPEHYFVLSMAGDSANPNLYYGCSRVSYHEKGMTRYQVQRFREFPGNFTMFSEPAMAKNHEEIPYSPDTTLFDTTKCVIKDGIIYDAVIEVTDSTILLLSCNGDREKIFNNGKSVYLPATGGEAYSYRVEKF
jgi:hypothetical protein